MSPKFDWNNFDSEESPKGGQKFKWEDFQDEADKNEKAPKAGSAGQAALEHFGNAASLGYLPQMQAFAKMVTPDPGADVDAKLKSQGFDIQQPKSNYISDRDANIKRLDQQSQDYPYASAAGSVGGAIASGAAMSGPAPFLGITKGIAPINAVSRLGRVLQAAKGGAILGAVSNPGDKEGEVADGLQLGERAKNSATGGALGAAGQGIVEGLSKAAKGVMNLPKTLQNSAEERAFKASGAMLKDYRKAAGQDRINELGKYMFDNGLVKPGMAVDDIAKAAETLKTQHGEKIGDILKKLDEAGAAGPSHQELASAIETQALPLKDLNTSKPTYNTLKDVASDIRVLGKPKAPAAGTLNQLTGKGEEFLLDAEGNPIGRLKDGNLVGEGGSGSVTQDGTVPSNPNLKATAGTFQGAQDVKKFLSDQVEASGGWHAPNPSEKNQALRNAYSTVSDKLEEAAQNAAQSSGDKGLLQDYIKNKEGYRNSTELSKIAKDKDLRQKANNFLSLNDSISGGAGAVIGAMSGDSLEEKAKHAAMGAGIGLASKVARNYGTPFVSVGLKKAGELLSRTPLAAAGEIAAPALNAAERSPLSIAGAGGVMSRPQLERSALRSVANEPDQPKGENRWAQNGLDKLSIQDPATVSRLLQSPQGKRLLIQASDLEPGSKSMQKIRDQIQKGWGKK